ncbi:MAG TPA: hypothetical protein V6C81_18265 [Planktothrix sp.]|jgi:hypothetical protein
MLKWRQLAIFTFAAAVLLVTSLSGITAAEIVGGVVALMTASSVVRSAFSLRVKQLIVTFFLAEYLFLGLFHVAYVLGFLAYFVLVLMTLSQSPSRR